jgi:hypothetical protein
MFSAATRACSAALGWMALTMVLAADLVEGLGAVAGGVDARARWSAGARRSARPPGSGCPLFSGSRCWAHAGGADHQVGLQHCAGGQPHLQRAAVRGRVALDGLDPGAGVHLHALGFSHQRLIMPPAVGPIMRGTMRSPISTTLSCTPRDGQRLHDDAADEAGAHLQHARAGLARAWMARASASVQQVCTPAAVRCRGWAAWPATSRWRSAAGRRAAGCRLPAPRARGVHRTGAAIARSVMRSALEVVGAVAQVGAASSPDVADQQVGNGHARIRRLGLVADQHVMSSPARACAGFRRR